MALGTSAAASPYITAEEACAYLRRKSLKAFYAAIVNERIPHYRDGQRFLFVPAELDRWLAERAHFGAGERPDRQAQTPFGIARSR
jgi:excisionase family DNA binding protein